MNENIEKVQQKAVEATNDNEIAVTNDNEIAVNNYNKIAVDHDSKKTQIAIMKILQVVEQERKRLDNCLEEGIVSQEQHDRNMLSLEQAKWKKILSIQ